MKWPRHQQSLFFSFVSPNGTPGGDTVVFKLAKGQALPDLPAQGIKSAEELRKMANTRVITHANHPGVFPGPTPDSYAFQRSFVKRNLYRIVIE